MPHVATLRSPGTGSWRRPKPGLLGSCGVASRSPHPLVEESMAGAKPTCERVVVVEFDKTKAQIWEHQDINVPMA